MARQIVLRGQVVDDEARPVAGARVRLSPAGVMATTGDDGAFVFEHLGRKRYRVRAAKGDHYTWPVIFDAERPREPVVLQLRLGATFIVHVHANRAPVVGAKVILDDVLRATTDASGVAVARGLAPRTYFGRLVADGWAAESLVVSVREDPGGVDERFVTLRAAARVERGARPSIRKALRAAIVRAARRLLRRGRPTRIAGVVVDAAGVAVPRATVLVLATTAESGGSMTLVQRSEEADANGRFDIEQLEDAEYDVIVEAPTARTHGGKERVRHRVETGDLELELALAPGGAIEGRVVLDGVALPYFGVSLTSPPSSGGTPIGIRTSDGRFVLRHVRPGTWRVAVSSPGTRLGVVGEVVVEAGRTVSVGDVAMERGQRIAGHVRDAAGAPVAGARVVVGHLTKLQTNDRSRLERSLFGNYDAATDAEGAYSFAGVDAHRTPGTPHIWATHPIAGVSLIRALGPGDASLDFELARAGHIRGTIERMRGGRPTVEAVRADEPAHARMAFADKDGRFELEDLPIGEYVVNLNVGGESVSSANVIVAADVTAAVTLAMGGTSVHLAVRVPAGRGRDLVLEPVSERAKIGGRVRGCVRTSGEDRCTFDFVQPGDYRASIDGQRWHPITIAAAPAEQTVDLRQLA